MGFPEGGWIDFLPGHKASHGTGLGQRQRYAIHYRPGGRLGAASSRHDNHSSLARALTGPADPAWSGRLRLPQSESARCKFPRRRRRGRHLSRSALGEGGAGGGGIPGCRARFGPDLSLDHQHHRRHGHFQRPGGVRVRKHQRTQLPRLGAEEHPAHSFTEITWQAGRCGSARRFQELGIDDLGGPTDQEREATVEDLLGAGSGVYHAASNPGDNLADAPPRGSQKHGAYYWYSNWDFNALGTSFEQETGRNIYDALEAELAQPIGFEDWNRAVQVRSGDTTRSIHKAYHMHLSTRDMARVGYLMLRGGRFRVRVSLVGLRRPRRHRAVYRRLLGDGGGGAVHHGGAGARPGGGPQDQAGGGPRGER